MGINKFFKALKVVIVTTIEQNFQFKIFKEAIS